MASNTEELGLEVFVEGWQKFERIMDKLDKSIDDTAKEMNKTGGIAGGAFAVALGTIAVNAAMALGRALWDAGKSVIAFGADSLQMAADFQSQMAILEIAASSTGLSFDVLHDAALQVGGDTRLMGVSATGAADAMTGLFKAGLSNVEVFGDLEGYMAGTSELGGALAASINLAAASELDMVQASDLAAVALASFGGELETEAERAEFVNEAMNNFVQAADASVAEVSDLADGLRNVGPVASALGMSIEDTNNALAVLSTRGIQGAQAGTVLKSMLTNMQRPTKAVQEAWTELGVSIFDTEGTMRDIPDIIGDMNVAMAGYTDQQKNLIVQQIAGTYGMNAMNTLLAEGEEGWYAMADATEAAAGIQEQAAARSQTYNAQMEALEGTIETLKIGIGEQFLPVATSLATWFADMVTEHGPAIQAAFSAVGSAVGQVASVLTGGQSAFEAITKILDTFLPDDVIDGVGSLGDALSFIRDGLESGGISDALVRIQLVIQEAFGMDAAQKFNSFRTFVEETLPEAIEKAKEAFEGIRSWVVENWPIIRDTVMGVVETIREWFDTNWPIIQAVAVTAFEVIRDVVLAVVAVFQETIIPKFQAAFDTLTEALDTLGIDWDDVWEAIKTAVGVVAAVIGAILLALVGVITGIIQAVAGVLEYAAETWQMFSENVERVVEGIGQVLVGWWEFVAGLFTGNEERMAAGFAAFWEGIKNLVISAWETIVIVFRSTFGILSTAVSEFIQGVIGFFQELYDKLVGNSIITDMLADMVTAFTEELAEIVTAVATTITNIIDGIVKRVTDFLSAGREVIQALKDGVQEIAGNLITDMFDLGVNMFNAIKEGVESILQDVLNFFSGAIKSVIDKVEEELGMDSPSKVFIAIGENIGQGLIDGINSTAEGVADAIAGLFDIGGALGTVGGAMAARLKKEQLDPVSRHLADLRDRLRGLQEERKGWETPEMLRLFPGERLRVLEREEKLQEEITKAEAEQLRIEKQLLALEKQRSDLAFLKQQADLLDLIKDHGLDAADILGGIEFGLDASLEGIIQAMTAAMSAIVSQVESELEISSPSAVFARIGARMMEGLSEGVGRLAPMVSAQINSIVQAPAQAMLGAGGGPTTFNDNRQFNLETNSTTRPGGLAMEFQTMSFASR